MITHTRALPFANPCRPVGAWFFEPLPGWLPVGNGMRSIFEMTTHSNATVSQ